MPAPAPPFEARAADILTDDQIAAVGKVAIEWGMLEFALHVHGQAICQVPPGMLTFGILTGKPDGRRLAETLIKVAPTFLGNKHPAVVETLKSILKRVDTAGVQRHDIVHGVWNITPAVMGTMMPARKYDNALNVTIKQAGSRFNQISWSTGELLDLAEEIAQIRLDLTRLMQPSSISVGASHERRATGVNGYPAEMGRWTCNPSNRAPTRSAHTTSRSS